VEEVVATAASDARKGANMVATRSDVKEGIAVNAVKKEPNTAEGRDVKSMASVDMKEEVEEAMVEKIGVRITDQSDATKAADTVEAIAPAADTPEEVKAVMEEERRDVKSLLATATGPAVDTVDHQDMADRQITAETQTKSRGVRKLNAMTNDLVVETAADITTGLVEAMIPTTTVHQGPLVDMEVTQAPTEVSNRQARPTAVAMAAQTSSLVLLSMPNRAPVTQATPTCSVWLSVC
jgi:hypothetical protein